MPMKAVLAVSYNLSLDLKQKQEEKKMHEQLMKNISDKPFIIGTDSHRCNRSCLNCVGKYQDCFIDDNQLKNYVFPFLSVDDPYEATKEEILRAKWLEENKILHGQFKPA